MFQFEKRLKIIQYIVGGVESYIFFGKGNGNNSWRGGGDSHPAQEEEEKQYAIKI
jgi:hypothetical protein